MKKICLLLILFITACGPTAQKAKLPKIVTEQKLQGTVLSVKENIYEIQLNLPNYETSNNSVATKIAKQVTKKSLFLQGVKTSINNAPAVINNVNNDILTVSTEKPNLFTQNSIIQIDIPKITIAVVDFEVIKGKDKSVGKVTLEDLTTALIKEGHFNVLERSKLKTVLDEINLSLSGLSDEQVEANLAIADLILTGTVAKIGSAYKFNLRLINVHTGQAVAAFSESASITQLSNIRDASEYLDNFELSRLSSTWNLGSGKKGMQKVSLEKKLGYQSKQSVRLTYQFKKTKAAKGVFVENRKKRDLSMYTGVEFDIKSSSPIVAGSWIYISNPENPKEQDAWHAQFEIDEKWTHMKIPFEEFIIGQQWIKKGASRKGLTTGKEILDLSHVEIIGFGLKNHKNRDNKKKGKVWVDNIKFYTE